VADIREKLKIKAFQQKVKILLFSPETRQPKHSSTLAKDRLKKMIHQSSEGSDTPATPSPHPYFLSVRTRRIVSFLIVLIIGGGLAAYLRLFPVQPVPSTQTSETIIIRRIPQTPSSQPTPTPLPQQPPTPTPLPQRAPTPTPTPQPQQTPTPPIISPAIPAGNLLYSTPYPFSACDKQGGHWTDTSDARITCTPDGSKMINTSGQLAVVNLDQLAGNQSPWPSQSFIVQITINSNSDGAFGIDFQPETGDNPPGYFAYLLSPPHNWAFNYYTPQGNLSGTLIAAPLFSPVSTKFTLDIRVEGTSYTFYINGVDTTGLAITGSQFINKTVGLAVDANADITFSNFAIYALP
jgi:hypothetical protein